jgi:hypothetical protein
MRHALGILGVAAAGVLLAVSAAMNWRFGYSLGKTEMDGLIYGAASAAADCFKALVPFFFFAAIKNRMWSQAAASAVVWVVVTAYSFTAAIGHAALNRQDVSGQRAVEATSYKDLRADLKRAQDEMSWLPKYRPAQAVQAEIDGMKNQRQWSWTKGCTDVNGKSNRDFCQKFADLGVERASADRGANLEARISDLNSKLAKTNSAHAGSEADPQAAVLTKLAGMIFPNVKLEDVQMALTLFVAILLEVGSGFGMYVAFATWRMHDRLGPQVPKLRAPAIREVDVVAGPVPVPAQPKPKLGANDNSKALPQPAAIPQQIVAQQAVASQHSPQPARLVAPESDVERFMKERVETTDGSSLTATEVYEEYCQWCSELQKEPLALPTFGRDFGELGVQKARIAGRIRYIGIGLKKGYEAAEAKKLPAVRVA